MTINHERRKIGQSDFSNLVGIETVKFEKGDVVLNLTVEDKHINGIDTVHGGVIATLIDNIIGATISSLVSLPSTTVNLNIQYLQPATNGKLTARGSILHQGYKLVTGEGIITDENGILIAKGTGTFKILHSKK
ncbi:PaaI family thioesterase [Bacillus pinisoli]|uniref:PaaI family thioesterase n=1 Tax=Bacillus pinisoli TaxID=2901866 RepID=UPI001FF134E2|nr:PaaI family thioesterase [Bacillus pinisoli]